jgi:hypothetical protein
MLAVHLQPVSEFHQPIPKILRDLSEIVVGRWTNAWSEFELDGTTFAAFSSGDGGGLPNTHAERLLGRPTTAPLTVVRACEPDGSKRDITEAEAAAIIRRAMGE